MLEEVQRVVAIVHIHFFLELFLPSHSCRVTLGWSIHINICAINFPSIWHSAHFCPMFSGPCSRLENDWFVVMISSYGFAAFPVLDTESLKSFKLCISQDGTFVDSTNKNVRPGGKQCRRSGRGYVLYIPNHLSQWW